MAELKLDIIKRLFKLTPENFLRATQDVALIHIIKYGPYEEMTQEEMIKRLEKVVPHYERIEKETNK